MNDRIAVHWFRQDLRLCDNPALAQAARHGRVLPLYILDDEHAGAYAMGGASRWWLHHSLASLDRSLSGCLSLYRGNPFDVLADVIAHFDVQAVYWNRCYEPWRINRDTEIKKFLRTKGVQVETCNGSLLWEPWTVRKNDGTPYKVFTPFYHKGCLQVRPPGEPIPVPANVAYQKDQEHSLDLRELNLLPRTRWDKKLEAQWQVGEDAARARFRTFIHKGLPSYKEGRNFPAKPYVSRLSPHLHFGEISPNQIWYALTSMGDDKPIDHFCRQLGWREFSYSQLYYNPYLPTKNLQAKFDDFPWVENNALLDAWQRGRTGIPLVDAGMRELWQTGYMHNRMRMVVGSFLVKNLRLHWRHGAQWFWDTLVDADLANNSAGWQWIAGCGADAAPYFRIFNPVTQGHKFDPGGHYVRQYIPEIASLPERYIFSPWEAPASILTDAGVNPGSPYPAPVVDLKSSREAALAAFQSLKTGVR